ncbi:hypothetical protein BJY01DRAFT_246088 [Aspergillus pseudoustus]|uniref:BZIP domain-containing protein n=1 Tax=Aspergillus pseudoustus TaxID=1810923 RepID=A0ABR4KAP0_9EURO
MVPGPFLYIFNSSLVYQQKFRRQRKDYIANLERELRLCRDSAGEELHPRRRQVETLKKQRTELRELPHHVATTLERISKNDDDDDLDDEERH